MSRITFVQVVYNSKKYIPSVFSAIFSQTITDYNVVAVISGNDDGGKELLQEKFPNVEIIDPGYNIGFAKGHNLVFEKYDSEFFQLVNPDLIMEPDYTEKVLKALDDPAVGAVTGKLYKISNFQFPIPNEYKTKVIDTTGVVIAKSGRARDRGQHEIDEGQYDASTDVQSVSAAGAMYRRAALMDVREESGFFDQDFHSYWEDVDLTWRMVNKGWKCKYVPEAVAYHGRGAGSHRNGYVDVLGYIKHHKTISPWVRQLNYKNHIFMYVKNSKNFYLQFFIREFFMLGYILLFEWSTLKSIPNLIRMLPKMWQKRKLILAK